ncbi:MAG: ABC transporter permease, partial [Chloroflexi bacterium]
MNFYSRLRRFPFWSWVWFIIGALYFILPLFATFEFSLTWDPEIPLKAYQRAFEDNDFWETFGYSNMLALATIIASVILIVPTAYWIRLRLPEARRIVEFITLMPFVVPAIILVFGMIRIYSSPIDVPFTEIQLMQPLTNFKTGTNILIVAGYMVLAMPYMYRSVDTGMRTVDIRTLT